MKTPLTQHNYYIIKDVTDSYQANIKHKLSKAQTPERRTGVIPVFMKSMIDKYNVITGEMIWTL